MIQSSKSRTKIMMLKEVFFLGMTRSPHNTHTFSICPFCRALRLSIFSYFRFSPQAGQTSISEGMSGAPHLGQVSMMEASVG
jgi:hypothetical protein